ncbi:MAG TPA: PAS domain-containing protein [Steroidobacteraceae bacterium]|jgi:PAS domain S-box-containing protein|nr:PAS domain-containing protein [Steroidobacteraceae bacterium]
MQFELAHLVEALPGLGWAALPDGRAEYLNKRWLAYTGLTAERAAGSGWIDAIHPDDRQHLIDHWRNCVASGTPGDTEARMRRYDGAYRGFLFRSNPLRDSAGNISRWFGTNIDIEDRRRNEEALRASELSWRQIVDNIPGLVATMGPMGEVEFLNQQILEYFGKTRDELKDWSLVGAVHPDDLPHVIEVRTRSIETGGVYQVEHRCRGADGTYRWFQVRGQPVRNAAGEITAWYLLLTDIEDRKKAEEALRSSERNLTLILNTIPTFIHVLGADGAVLYVNQAVLDYTGFNREDVQQEDYRTRHSHPADLHRMLELRVAALKQPVPFEAEMRTRSKDGSYRWFLNRYSPLLDAQGQLDRWYVVSFDIEDRKRTEAQLEQAYLRLAEAQRLSKTGSFITDLLVDDHQWSEEAFRIFEFDPQTKVTVQMIRDRVHPEDLPSFDGVITRGMSGEDLDFYFRILTAGGGVKHVRGMARVMEQVAGRPLFIGAFQDVTESRAAEEALNRVRSELAQVSRVTTLNTLTGSIAHEVNQPLAGIITNASTCSLMLNGNPPNVEGAQETVRRILRDGKRAADVISRLRTLFSRKEFTVEPVDLNEATREVIALSLSDLRANRVILRPELAEDLPQITGDRVQLQQVTLNLLRNASDAMVGIEDRPRELLIKTEKDEGDAVRLTVKDVGVGFSAEVANKLFDAFYTTKSDGMGIGLSVSRTIIEAHHGRLAATANEGPGATFYFSIPCKNRSAHTM